MAEDPNNIRWAQSKSFGKEVLKKSGWVEGEGLGKSQEGIKRAVKVSKKDDVTGIGYQAGVGETWSAQSVGFADVLDRIKGKIRDSVSETSESSENQEEKVILSSTSSSTSPVGSKYTAMYAKRHALKTEGLQNSQDASKAEILGASFRKRSRVSTPKSDTLNSLNDRTTLKSSVLQRLMVRVHSEEPQASSEDSLKSSVTVVKPSPRPLKCSETPFLTQYVRLN